MLCSSCGAECADNLDVCPACGVSLKKSPVSDDTIPLPPITEVSAAHTRKKPVKLDIAAILAADTDAAGNTQPDNSVSEPDAPENTGEPCQSEPEAEPTAPTPRNPVEPENVSDEEPAQAINPTEVLLLSLCILLGLGIIAVIILIIWPTIIQVLFYHG